jgi:hypothetical protein
VEKLTDGSLSDPGESVPTSAGVALNEAGSRIFQRLDDGFADLAHEFIADPAMVGDHHMTPARPLRVSQPPTDRRRM